MCVRSAYVYQVTQMPRTGWGPLQARDRLCRHAGNLAGLELNRLARHGLSPTFGVGGGWNQDEMEDHGTVYATRFKRVRESIEVMREIWTKERAEYHGEFVNFDPMIVRPNWSRK